MTKKAFVSTITICSVVCPLATAACILWENTAMALVTLGCTTMCLLVKAVGLRLEVDAHQECHAKIDKGLVAIHRLHAFQQLEAIAAELDTLSDSLQGFPQNAFISTRHLSHQIEERARDLRAMAPDLPPIVFDEDMDLALDIDLGTKSEPS